MRIDYEISEQDFLAGLRLITSNLPNRGVRWIRRTPWLGGLILAWMIYAYATKQEEFSLRVVPALLISAFFISMPWLIRQTQKKLYAKTTAIHGKLCLEADDDGLRFQGPMYASKLEWSLYCRLLEDKDSFVLLQQGQMVGNMVPKRNLTPEEIAGLRDLFERRIVYAG